MKTSLDNAKCNKKLEILEIKNSGLVSKFHHLGLYEKDIIIRLDEDILISPLRIKGPGGMMVLGGGMSAKIVAHLDDGRKIPVTEMSNGESGHIEGIVGGTGLARTMDILGLKNDDRITLVRKLPPMEYSIIVDSMKRVKISESIAAKIWGYTDGQSAPLQFSSSGKGKKFLVDKILGGKRSAETVFMHGGIKPGSSIVLEGVKPIDTFAMSASKNKNLVIISKADGLRLIMDKRACSSIIVRQKEQ
ncbi:MAG: hypothetical protein CSA18_04260 [Deltaproteobacteria bacterium]|nr:MAG: hypothetical protein CSA18_04260 [Deltaproteobacteria bacterium]